MNTIIKECEKIITNLIRFGNYESRTYMINYEKKLIYLSNPKVACTSLKANLFNCNIEDDERIHSILCSHRKSEITKKDFSNYFIYTYVRNPFERLVSCYKNKVCKQKHYYDSYLCGFILPDKGFEAFVNKVFFIPDCFSDRHFRSQYSLIYKKGKCMVDFVGKIETIKESFPKLAKKYNLSPLQYYNATKKNNWMDYYTISTAKKVYKRYKMDFKKFGYDEYYYELIDYLKNK